MSEREDANQPGPAPERQDELTPFQPDITLLLRRVEKGDDGARDELLQALYGQIYRQAERAMRKQGGDHTLQATALVNEVYLRLFREGEARWTDQRHFLLGASRAMKHVLVDHARKKTRAKRQGVRADLPLDLLMDQFEESVFDFEAFRRALEELAEADPKMARAVELEMFTDATQQEIADVLELKLRTYERRWQMTRRWLYARVMSS